jgi:hypothetical protein
LSAPQQNGWAGVASSSDGTKVVAAAFSAVINGPGLIYTSTNAGGTWAPTTAPASFWASVASSADGRMLAAAEAESPLANDTPGLIYTSQDSGSTWQQSGAPSNNWGSVVCSADGTKLMATYSRYLTNGAWINAGSIYASADSGTTWTRTSAPEIEWSSIASSVDGTKLVAAAGGIYTSGDSGTNWTRTSAPSNNWGSVACSANGTKLIAADYGFGPNPIGPTIWASTNSGVTWVPTSAPNNRWGALAASADGTKIVAADSGEGDGVIYISADSGATWQTVAPPEIWMSIACSADFTKLFATTAGLSSSIYGLQLPLPPPSPPMSRRLEIAPHDKSLRISWLISSTSVLLQENSDLSTTNWTDVSPSPTLNFTNLHYEVTVSSSHGSRFYRLKQQ